MGGYPVGHPCEDGFDVGWPVTCGDHVSKRTGFGIWNPGGADMDLRRHGGLHRGRCGPMKTGLDDRGHCRNVDRHRPGVLAEVIIDL